MILHTFPDEDFNFELLVRYGHLWPDLYGFLEVQEYLPEPSAIVIYGSVLDDVVIWDKRLWIPLIRYDEGPHSNFCMIGLTGSKSPAITSYTLEAFSIYTVHLTKKYLKSRKMNWLYYALDTDEDVSRFSS